ncbi:CPBP family intramembrane glutamic endopeptidase [Microbacterium sp. P03]|uniref:CPBP family intramembrane glutamic endopeptidase n=1 Tax=Microbacterium sp. P03 TaxID=3366946 RepID=UPI003744E3CE
MAKTPDTRPGSSSFLASFTRPTPAIVVLTVAFVVAAVVGTSFPGVSVFLPSWPAWVLRALDIAVLSAPLVIGAVLAVRVGTRPHAWVRALRRWRVGDLLIGACVGALVRAAVELSAPTTGSLEGPFVEEPSFSRYATLAVVIVTAVLLSPVIEEVFFRGIALPALANGLRGAGPTIAGTVALVLTTAAFVALHLLPLGGSAPLGLVIGTIGVGVGCGILTLVTGRLAAALAAHIVFNTIGVVLMLG